MPDIEQSTKRWIIVIASALILALAMGSIVNGMSAYIIPMQESYGWARTDTALINVAGIMGLALGGLLTGPLADRFGTRPVVVSGAIVMGLSYLATSIATELWQFYALIFVAGFFGAAAISVPIMAAVGSWFPIGAGLAIGIAAAGQALGQGGVPFVSSVMIEAFGISNALALTGGAMLLLMVPLALILGQPPTSTKAAAASVANDAGGYQKFSTFVPVMCVATLLCCTCMSVPLMHLVPLIQDRGFEPEEASGIIFLMLMVAITGRIAFGKLADIVGPLRAYMTATAWMTLLVYGFIHMGSLSEFSTYAVIYGLGYGGVMTGILVSVATLIHPSRRASAMGIVTMFAWFGHANGGFLGGYLFDMTGNYQLTYAIAAASGVLNLFIVGTFYMKTRGPALVQSAA